MHFPEGFLLGLSTGAVCMAYCGPVLIPYLMGEGNPIGRNAVYVALFLAGRLIAYIITGIIAGILGQAFLHPSPVKTILMGAIYIVLAVLLITYGFYRFREICLGQAQNKFDRLYGRRWPYLVPLTGGVITGLNICPPFLLAITKAIDTGQIAASVWFFILFFLGTSLYFIPFPFIGFFRRQEILRIIGKFAAILAGLFYFYRGLIMLIQHPIL
jgi:sulfite exporter TauE/SafE